MTTIAIIGAIVAALLIAAMIAFEIYDYRQGTHPLNYKQ